MKHFIPMPPPPKPIPNPTQPTYGAIDRFVARHEWSPYVGLVILIVIGSVITNYI